MSDSLHIVCPHCGVTNRIPEDKLQDNPNCGKCHQAVFTGQPLELDSTNFDKYVTRNDIPVLVDFWAPWCGPCISMAPALVSATKTLEPKLRVAKLNTEEAQELAARYDIRSIPTLIVFKNGQEAARQAGAMDANNIVKWVKAAGGVAV